MDGSAIGLRVGVGVSDNGGGTGGHPSLTSPALVVSLAIIGVLSLTIFSIYGRRAMYAARRRRLGQGMEQQIDSETREDQYLFLADMLGLDVGLGVRRMRGGIPQPPLLDNRPKLWNIHAMPCGTETRMERLLCWGDITVSNFSIISGVGLLVR